MDKEKKKKMEQKNELTNSGQRFPVEQVSNTGKPTTGESSGKRVESRCEQFGE